MLLQHIHQSVEGKEDDENATVATVKGYSFSINITVRS